jgi:glycosyltransferase involved in cell wall biosynthesis
MNNKKISIIVPTLGERVYELNRLVESLNNQIYKNFEVIFVTQQNHNNVIEILNNAKFYYKHIKVNKKGLSYARNQGIKYVTGDIVTLSDDDCWYPKEAFRIVEQSFRENNSDIICFQIYDPESKEFFKKYPVKNIVKLDFKYLFKISSIEIFINLEKANKKDIMFDERFGLGAKYPSGEENILLFDLMKKNYCISYIPKIIVFHKKSKLTKRKSISPSIFISKGPLFRRITNLPMSILMFITFFIKKFKLLERPFYSFWKGIQETLLFKN